MLSETSSRDTSSASPAVTTCVGVPLVRLSNRQLTLHPPRTEAGFPPQAGSSRPPPCQAPPQQGTLVLPPPQDRRAQEEVGPWMHRRCRCPRPRPRCRQAGRERHPRLDRSGPPQAPWTQGAFRSSGNPQGWELIMFPFFVPPYSVLPRSVASLTSPRPTTFASSLSVARSSPRPREPSPTPRRASTFAHPLDLVLTLHRARSPKIQRLVTPERLQRRRHLRSLKRRKTEQQQVQVAEYKCVLSRCLVSSSQY